MFLEQLILKHGVDESCSNVKDIHEGVDFFFANRQHAIKFIDFLQNVVPIRCCAARLAALYATPVHATPDRKGGSLPCSFAAA